MLMDAVSSQIRVSLPGVIQSFDATEQTVSVQPAIQEVVSKPDLSKSNTSLPLLVDVPLVFPRGGGFSLTFPVAKGDECLIVFADLDIDSWWQNGGSNNAQNLLLRHDLSNAFAILAPTSQPKVLPSYSTSALEIRSDDGSTYISMQQGEIDIQASTVKINGINFSQHVHSDPQGGTTGPPQ